MTHNEYMKEYIKTFVGKTGTMYQHQKTKSRKRGHVPPLYSLDDFRAWVLDQPNQEKLFQDWAESGYSVELSPSVDRLDNNKPYSFDNIRLVTWGENDKVEDVPVNVFSLDGVIVDTFASVKEAAYFIGVNGPLVSQQINGKVTVPISNKYVVRRLGAKFDDFPITPTKRNRRVRQLTPDMSSVIREYNTVMEAATLTGADSLMIRAVCRGDRCTHFGYSWEYLDF